MSQENRNQGVPGSGNNEFEVCRALMERSIHLCLDKGQVVCKDVTIAGQKRKCNPIYNFFLFPTVFTEVPRQIAFQCLLCGDGCSDSTLVRGTFGHVAGKNNPK